MKEKLKQLLFPNYTKWEKLLITQNGIHYRLIMQRRNEANGLYEFKSVRIGEIDELPSLETLNNLIK